MADSPIPEVARRPDRTIIAALACALVLGTAAVVVYVTTRPSTGHPVVAAPAPTASTAPSPTPVALPVAPPKPAVPHQYVAPAAPTAFTLTGPRFTIKADVCAMPPVFPLDPPGDQHHTVCWVTKGFGVAPGSNSRTSYVLGHSWAPDRQEVLNRASAVATREILRVKPWHLPRATIYPVKGLTGYRLVLKTKTGILTYRVHDTFGVPKTQLGYVKHVMNARVANRIVVITCAELHGVDYEYNVVLNAYLVSSVRKPVT
ncbi:MAG: hypothetical protein QOG01_4323 [Pseudonocardiales bacterium]|jgi:hypothetical protein|nr:hypothetical protein [Pseudonocardiales bacterium]